MTKKQQMQWSKKGAHYLLQTRTTVLNNELQDKFTNWYPGFLMDDQCGEKASSMATISTTAPWFFMLSSSPRIDVPPYGHSATFVTPQTPYTNFGAKIDGLERTSLIIKSTKVRTFGDRCRLDGQISDNEPSGTMNSVRMGCSKLFFIAGSAI